MPISVCVLSSTVWSSTMFMNWSKPRRVPVTFLLPFKATVNLHTWKGQQSCSRARTGCLKMSPVVHEALELWWSNLGHVGPAVSCSMAVQSSRALVILAGTIVQALKLAAAPTQILPLRQTQGNLAAGCLRVPDRLLKRAPQLSPSKFARSGHRASRILYPCLPICTILRIAQGRCW